MASIDERIVSISFENTKFEASVARTMATLGKLDSMLASVGKTSGLQNIEAEANKVTLSGPMTAIEKLKGKIGELTAGRAFSDLEGASDKTTFSGVSGAIDKLKAKLHFPEAKTAFAEMEAADDKVTFADAGSAIEGLSGKFGAMQVAGVAAFGTIVSQATQQIGGLLNQVTGVKSAIDGFSDYELKIGATQTIMAGTGESIGKVSMYLKDLDTYADRTIYSLRDMTGNIGKFTNAGVKLPIAVDAMKGIANVAALSGANSNEASRAMYNLGQAIGQGTVRLMDWRSVELANMGTKEFKQELINAALATGELEKGADGLIRTSKGNIVNSKNFTSTLQDQWLTSEALVKTLRKYSDESTNLGKRAYAAATDVKTFSMMIETLAAAAGTGWTDTFEILFGNLPEATKLWTGLTNVIGGFIGRSADARNEVLEEWKKLGGRADFLEGLKNAFNNLMDLIRPIGEAFRNIFPRKTGEDLAEMSENFRKLTERLKPSPELVDNLRRIFEGFFAALHIGWTIIKRVGGVIFDLFGIIGSGSGGFLPIIASIGDFVVAVDKALTQGDALKGVFESLTAVIRVPLEIIKAIAGAIIDMFRGSDPKKAEGVADSMDKLDEALRPLRGTLDVVKDAWKKFLNILDRVRGVVEPAFTNIIEIVGDLGNKIADAFNNINWDQALNALEVGLIGGIFAKLRSALGGGLSELGGGLFQNINGILKGLTGNLEAMQRTLQAATLLQIAGAIAVLAVGILILSKIDPKSLSRAMAAVAIGLAQLVGVFIVLSKVGTGGFAQMPMIAGSMILLASAVTILAVAMKIMSTMSWEEIGKGLAGVAGVLVAVGAATQGMNGPKLLVTAAALIPLAIGLNILAVAVKIFATMSWEELARGIGGVGVALAAIAGAMILMPPNMILTGAGLVLIAGALTLLSGAVSAFGSMDLIAMYQGILGIAGAIAGIALAMGLMPPTLPLTAAGLILVSIALGAIAAVIAVLGNMDIGTLVKGIAAIGATLAVLALGLTLMIASLPGSAALLVAAAALAVLGPTLAFLGTLKWSTIFKGLLTIALTLGVLAVAGAIAAVPLIALGAALVVLGVGIAAIGGGLYLIAKGFQLIGAEGAKGIAAVIAAIGAFIIIFPKMVIDFVKGLVTILAEIVKLAPAIVTSLVSIASTLLDAIIELAPKLAEAISAILTNLIEILQKNSPKLITAGFELVRNLLTGIRDNISQIISLGADVIINLINGIAKNAPRLVNAGVNALNRFLNGITVRIPSIVPVVGRLITKFLDSVTAQIPRIVQSAVNLISGFLNAVARNVHKFIAAGTNLIISFLDGVQKAIPRLIRKGLDVAETFLNGIADGLVRLADIGFRAVIKFLRGLERSIRENMDDLIEAGAGVADAIIDGITEQFGKAGGVLRSALTKVFDLLPGWAKDVLGISSPSTVFAEIGKMTMLGFAQGISDNAKPVRDSSNDIANAAIDGIKVPLKIRSPSEVMRELGKEVTRGFANGIEGSVSDIRGAFASLNSKLKEQIKSSKDTIASESATLNDLLKAEKPDLDAIKASQKVISDNEKIVKKATAARRTLLLTLNDEKKRLVSLTKQYDDITARLDAAKQALADATRERDDAAKAFTEKYSELPDIDEDTNLEEYKAQLKERIKAVRKYHETLAALRKLGLDDTTYRMLLEEGTAGQEFADQLLAGGKDAVSEINVLDADLKSVAGDLGNEAAKQLYQAGVDAAQGLVDGLKAKQAELKAAMELLADHIVNALKVKLKIKSPSQEFAAIAKQAILGLSQGFKDSAKEATSAAAQLGTDTLSALSDAIAGNIDVEPVITPVMDLTKVEQGAKDIQGLTNVTPITAAASFGQASAISEAQKTAEAAKAAEAVSGPVFNYEQNNYSPEALSDIEIYRQTKNQLSQVKSVLGLTPA